MKVTSAAVSGVPFENFTPFRIVNVIALPPSDQVHFVASQGYTRLASAGSNWISGS